MTTDAVCRRRVILGSFGLACSLVPGVAPARSMRRRPRARRLDLDDPADCLHAVVKLRGDLDSARPVLQAYTGTLTVMLPGRLPLTVARYQGLIRTDWSRQDDGSYRYRTFDLGFFGDLDTGRPLERLVNPITDQVVEPMDVRDGPIESLYTVNGVIRDGAKRDPAGKLSLPWRSAGDELWYEANLGFERANPLPPAEFPDVSGSERLVQRSLFTYQGRRSELEDPATTRAPSTTIQVVASTPLPWLRMGSVPATQLVHTVARKIASFGAASQAVREYVETVMPGFLVDTTPFASAGGSHERYRRERLGR